MPVRRQLHAGDTVRLRGAAGQVRVFAPDGLELRIPSPKGRVDLWVPQEGDWAVAWPDGTTETLSVAAARPPEVLSCTLTVTPGQPPAGYPLGQGLRLEARTFTLEGRARDAGVTFVAQSPAEGARPKTLRTYREQAGLAVAVLTPDHYGPWTVRALGGGAVAEAALYVARPA
jgi:hypothetical protein